LSPYHSVVVHAAGESLEETFDLCIIDGANLKRYKAELEARREGEQPGILPVLLLTSRRDIWIQMPQLWQLVDDSIVMPVSRPELQARVEILLRARKTSLELKLRNEDLEAFVQAMSHDLRASLRAIMLFAEALSESGSKRLTKEGWHDL